VDSAASPKPPGLVGLKRRAVVGVLIGLAIAGSVAAYRATGFDPSVQGGDAWNYLAAGERLNSGHDLYGLRPGDRDVVIVPPYWTVPLLAPPPIAVIWRPLAAIGPVAMGLWGAAILAATLASVLYLILYGGLLGLAVVSLLAAPLVLLALSGNVNGLILAAMILAWRFRERPGWVGLLIAFSIWMKLTPAYFLIWLLGARRIPALVQTGLFVLAIFALSLWGAGLQAHLDWMRSVPDSHPSPMSLSSLTGLPSVVVAAASAVIVALVALRGDERLTFSAAAVLSGLAAPALYFQALALLAAVAVPWIEPHGSRRLDRGRPPVGATS
jgi:hypothetical protein